MTTQVTAGLFLFQPLFMQPSPPQPDSNSNITAFILHPGGPMHASNRFLSQLLEEIGEDRRGDSSVLNHPNPLACFFSQKLEVGLLVYLKAQFVFFFCIGASIYFPH